jgi:hypothetical protein
LRSTDIGRNYQLLIMAFLKREEEEDVREIALVGETARFMPQWDEQIIGPQNTYKIEKEEKTKPLPLSSLKTHSCGTCQVCSFSGYNLS